MRFQPQDLAYFVLFLGILIFVHELGHFLVAKLLGVKVLRFSIGFGPKIFGFTRGETEYRVSWVPLGGYVKMAGEQPFEELPPEEAKRGFLAQAPWKRALIVLAGPGFNLLFPILGYFLVFFGSHQAYAPRVGSVVPELPAAQAGIRPGDRITAVDGEPVRTWDELTDALRQAYDRKTQLALERSGQRVAVELVPFRQVESNPVEKVSRGMIGIELTPLAPTVGVPSGSAAEKAGLKTFDRILAVNGTPVADELSLREVLAGQSGSLTLKVARAELHPLPGAQLQLPRVETATLEKQPGEGLEALGAEHAGPYVAQVAPQSPAAKAGIRPGDRLVSLNGRPISSWRIFAEGLRTLGDDPFTLEWRSGGELKKEKLVQARVEVKDELCQRRQEPDLGLAGHPGFPTSFHPEMVTVQVGPAQALAKSFQMVPEVIRQTAIVIAKLFTREVSFDTVGGPLMLFQVASKTAELGLKSFIEALAVLSINLGLMNLLPIPVLDGFHLLAAGWEGARRRPIPLRAREIANLVGLGLLAIIMVMVLRNDIMRAWC